MQQVLIDAARAGHVAEGGGRARLATPADADLTASMPAGSDHDGVALFALGDPALERLAAPDPPPGRLFELRSSAGLTINRTAAALGFCPATVSRA
jgi:hypothetical protein